MAPQLLGAPSQRRAESADDRPAQHIHELSVANGVKHPSLHGFRDFAVW